MPLVVVERHTKMKEMSDKRPGGIHQAANTRGEETQAGGREP